MHVPTTACFALMISCLHAWPSLTKSTHYNSVSSATFQMSKNDYLSYPWTTPNSSLIQISTDSKLAYGEHEHVECPSHVIEGDHVPLYRRATCPWYYVADHDPRRYPTTLLKAVPACPMFCIGKNGYQCEAITRTVTVLETTGSATESNVQFVQKDEVIPVGYTCAGARTVDNNMPATTQPDLPTWAK